MRIDPSGGSRSHEAAPLGGPARAPAPSRYDPRIVESYAALLERPEVRLRFLHHTLQRLAENQTALDRVVKKIPLSDLLLRRTGLYDRIVEAQGYLTAEEEFLAFQLPKSRSTGGRQGAASPLNLPPVAKLYRRLHRSRHLFYALAVVLVGVLLLGGYWLVTWSARSLNTYLARKYLRTRPPIVVTAASPGKGGTLAATGSGFLPSYQPERVWQVELTPDFERYSNGARILTRYQTSNRPRAYYPIPRGSATTAGEVRRSIVGIIYHTSESDIVPFIPANTQSIQYRSQGLLEYVQRNRSYNYLIDRFGEIYRIVQDDHAAFHAGHSIWADAQYSYVGLNESFLGICFESTSTRGSLEETLTEAQIVSGRALTNVLRSRYRLEDVNCTTHGLVSINPENMRIAYHHDWVRNFPFAAMGLSDKYQVATPSMLDYGFRYDEEILQKLGNTLWPGAIVAEEEFQRRARGLRVEEMAWRSQLRDRYLEQLEQARRLRSPGSDEGLGKITAE
ncbi:MAG: N-acetylmuramoyl-L-alanine amidase [Blastocatellia bacterium]